MLFIQRVVWYATIQTLDFLIKVNLWKFVDTVIYVN